MPSSDYTWNEIEEARRVVVEPERVFAYLTTAEQTVLTTADTYYLFLGTFENSTASGFTAGDTGITYSGDGDNFEIEWKMCGTAGETSELYIAQAFNATFDETTGEMLTGDICPGSCGGSQSVTTAAATAFVSPHSLCCKELVTGDLISLVVKSSTATNTIDAESACASLHRFG